MNRLALPLALLAALSACKRGTTEGADATPVKEIVAGAPMIDYDSERGAFSCLAPRDWGVREETTAKADGATFVGPRDPKTSGSAYITILRYPESAARWTDARKYAESFWTIDPKGGKPEIATEAVDGRTVLRFHQERPFRKLHSSKPGYMLRYDYALVPVEGGFFEIEHRAPAEAHGATLPVFEAVVKSFRPRL